MCQYFFFFNIIYRFRFFFDTDPLYYKIHKRSLRVLYVFSVLMIKVHPLVDIFQTLSVKPSSHG